MVDFERLRRVFLDRYGSEPRLFSAPGRVNLIGEHTDYNDGFVLPLASNLRMFVAAAPRSDDSIRAYSFDLRDKVEFNLRCSRESAKGWINYVYGVARTLQERGHKLVGADLVVASEIPSGAGLSSSAALEVAIGFALLKLASIPIDGFDLAFAAQEAEHRFVGTKSGLMDQLTAIFGKPDQALLIDCRSNKIEHIPLQLWGITIVVCDSKIKHELATSAYNQRRAESAKALGLLQAKRPGIQSLRDLGPSDLSIVEQLPEPMRRRARHVVMENDRTLDAANALRGHDSEQLGELMRQSHRSLQENYEVSCRELDLLVDLALRQRGVVGSRMMGGGFGGCTVNLVATHRVADFCNDLRTDYRTITGVACEVYVVKADDGVHEHEISASHVV